MLNILDGIKLGIIKINRDLTLLLEKARLMRKNGIKKIKDGLKK